MKLKIALCDDDALINGQMKNMLDEYLIRNDAEPTISFDYTYFQRAEALLRSDEKFDVIFLDIALGHGIDGIDLGKRLRERGCEAMFILFTSMERYQDGYKIGVLRYLMKPLDKIDLFEALDAAVREYRVPRKRFEVKTKSGSQYVDIKDIVMVERYYRKRIVHTVSVSYASSETWEKLIKRLPERQFYNPQASIYVNLEHVTSVGGGAVEMSNGRSVNFSRGKNQKNKIAEFGKIFHRYLGG